MSAIGEGWHQGAPPDEIRVLHVDDEPALTDLVATFLERNDERIETVTATSVSAGLDRLAENRIDCIVSDHDMPDQDGIEFLEAVREDYPDLPFILFTGKGSEEIASESISAGVTDYLQKEGGTEQYTILANRITNVVEQYRAQAAAEQTERRLRELAENTPDVRWMFDADWSELLFVNSAYEEVYGQPTAELESDPTAFLETIHPADRPAVRDAMETLSNGEAVEIEYRVNPETGYQRWVWVHGRPVAGQEGDVERVVGFSRDITEREERKQELEQFETMVNTVGDSIYTLDSEGRFTYVNDRFVEQTGYDRREVLGEHVSLVLSPEAIETGRAHVEQLLSDPATEATSYETTVLPAAGEPYPVELQITLLPAEEDAFAGTIGVVRDRSERREREQELREYEQLVEAMGEAVYVLDTDGRLVEVNERMERLTGYDRETLVGEHVSVLLDEADIETGERAIQELLEDDARDVSEYEETVRTADGARVRCAVRQTLLPSADGTFRGTVGTLRDVSDRHEHEQKLAALHDVAVALDACDSVRDICERTIEASRDILAFDLSAIGIEEDGYLVKQAVSEDVPPDGAARMSVEEGIAGRSYRTGESLLVDDVASHGEARPQGSYRSALSIPIGDHGVFQAVADDRAAFDESDLELAELLLGHTESALSRLEREQRLERQNEQLDEFASVVCHDLRNPLNVLGGNLELAAKTGGQEYFDRCQRAVERMDQLIDDVLTLAREADSPPDTGPTDLARLGERCFQAVETAEATLHLETDATVVADEDRLRQLLENLFRNAIEHAGPDVVVRVGDLDDGFYVEDDGPGIPVADRDDVFDAGYSTTEAGTGFGLAIADRVAQAHGWDLTVTDGHDGGARFEVRGIQSG